MAPWSWRNKAALAALVLLLPSRGRAGFEDLGAAARPLGMANAFTALADDSSALYFNPAGLAAVGRPELAASHSRVFMGLDDGSTIGHSWLAYVQPMKSRGTLGAGLLDLRLSGAYSERSYLLSYGRGVLGGLSAGATLKVLERGYTLGSDPHLAADPLFRDHGTRSRGYGLDLGTLYRASERVSLALALLDLNEPDMGLGSADRVPRSLKLGFAYRPEDLSFDADFARRDRDWDLLLGVERWLTGGFAGRVGLGFGSRSDKDVSAGLSLRAGHCQLDYAFQLPLSGVAGTAGTHRFSLALRLGSEPPRPAAKEPEAPAAPLPEKVEQRLKELRDELEKTRKDSEANQEILKRLEERLSRARKEPAPTSEGGRSVPSRTYGSPMSGTAKPAPRPKSYTVSDGETLQSIAQKLYGDSGRWVDLYRVNQDQIGAGGRLGKGQVLVVP